jgi:hypothetical protein
LGSGWRIALLMAHLPVDERTTRTFFVQLRDFFTWPFADGFSRGFTAQIVGEDRPTVSSQNPRPVPLDPAAELSTGADRLAVAYRRALRRYVDAGWALDLRELGRVHAEEQRVRVLPCPARRTLGDGAWVIGEVPRVPARAGGDEPD